ncbi:DUF5983 family protein [Rugosimonospora africana]|uniref:DUF5983 domain-containing protein n=1 Tax=Rugosimonospora africana TaxID=556532 RepID=A0A8J3QWQ9_9ACTN|nr:hypothetical protein [Rugosimonospora africana]GIH16131.1 hypothetical protein Raf01_43030 [Rugosimonospora africana]
MARIRNLLELSPRHLRPQVADTLPDVPTLHAAYTAFGTLVAVPNPLPQGRAASRLPEDILGVLRYARDLDCDYILIDTDADVDDDLPLWD